MQTLLALSGELPEQVCVAFDRRDLAHGIVIDLPQPVRIGVIADCSRVDGISAGVELFKFRLRELSAGIGGDLVGDVSELDVQRTETVRKRCGIGLGARELIKCDACRSERIRDVLVACDQHL